MRKAFTGILAILYVYGQVDLINNIIKMDSETSSKKAMLLFYYLYDAGMKFLFYYVIGNLMLFNTEVKAELKVLAKMFGYNEFREKLEPFAQMCEDSYEDLKEYLELKVDDINTSRGNKDLI